MKSHTRLVLFTAFVALTIAVVNFAPRASAQKSQQGSTKGVGKRPKVKPTPDMNAEPDEANENDSDRPPFAQGTVNDSEYLRRRQEFVNTKLGMEPGKPYDPSIREQAVQQMSAQEAKLTEDVKRGRVSPRVLSTGWTNIGPFPIPNGQTNTTSNAVSGRTVSIVVHPTNPDIVYAGTAQGGVYRTLNGGTTWTQIFNGADSQVIGAVAISPSNPEIVYVGTGEAGQCGSGCYAGIGVYRIDNASTTADLTGPINPQITTGVATPITYNPFTGRSISEILVAPTDPSVIFVATASAIVGNIQQAPQGGTIPPLGIRGLFRINNATGPIAGMTTTKLTVTVQPGGFDVPSTGNRSILDIAFDPADATGNTLVAFVNGTAAAGDGGVYRSTNALTTGTFTQTLIPVTSNIRGELAVARTSPVGQSVLYLASGETGATAGCTGAGQGAVRKSIDGGATWSTRLAGGSGFCGGQCFYDIAIDVSPTDANTVLLGGNVPGACTRSNGRSTNGGTTFPEASTGLHSDSHAAAFAPSNPLRAYQGNDGGIFRSDDGGLTWTSLNNRGYVATQFQSVSSHPTERSFLIGGTQDNGTQFLQPNPLSLLPYEGWTHSDVGDGGYARIDQTATDTTNVVMYHTYFNQTNAQGLGRVTNTTNAKNKVWTLLGCGFAGSTPNGFNCTTTTAVLFYAPFELGPVGVVGATGQPVYWGADALYRSINQGSTFVLASQQPITSGQAVASLAVAPQDDNYRVVGLTNGAVWGITTGLTPLVNITPTGMTNTRTIGKVIFDPNNKNTAFAAYGGQFGLSGIPLVNHIWKTINFNVASPTWTAVANGIPDTPVNALAIDPANSNVVFAGTDVGVYRSTDGGVNWNPYNTGMPKLAIFELDIQKSNRLLRAATHGRGIWEIGLESTLSISGKVTDASTAGVQNVTVVLQGSAPAPMTTTTDAGGNYTFSGLSVGGNYTVRPQHGTESPTLNNYAPTYKTFADLPVSQTNVNFVGSATGSGTAVSPGSVIISEFRLRGANGADDEFVELYNNTDSIITVQSTDGTEGWRLNASTGALPAVIPNGTVIPARAHFLLAGSAYSLNPRATPDIFLQNGIGDDLGLALMTSASTSNLADRLDAAGFSGAGAFFREGVGLAPLGANDAEYTLMRNLVTAFAQDTNDNVADFILVSITGTTINGITPVLGSPGPENTASPLQRGGTVKATVFDATQPSTATPNRVRDTTITGANRNAGTLTFRRKFTNNTGQPVTRLRFRVVDITTLNSPGYTLGGAQADLRLLDSSDVIISALTVKGTTTEQPPLLSLAGGVNTTATVILTGGSLAPGASVNVQFVLGVVQTGTFRIFVEVEALP